MERENLRAETWLKAFTRSVVVSGETGSGEFEEGGLPFCARTSPVLFGLGCEGAALECPDWEGDASRVDKDGALATAKAFEASVKIISSCSSVNEGVRRRLNREQVKESLRQWSALRSAGKKVEAPLMLRPK